MPRTAEVATTLRSRILAEVHMGLSAGVKKLPSVRTLAAEFDADHRTILGALRRLSEEGIIEMRPRSGNYVTLPQAWPRLGDADDEWLVDSVLLAFGRRVSPKELARRVLRITTPVRRALCIESTDEHRKILCSEVHESYGFSSSELDVTAIETLEERLADTDIVVTTMFHMVEVTRAARRVDRPVFMMTLDASLGPDIHAFLAAGPVYFIATDPRVTMKTTTALEGSRLRDNARPVIVGVDDPDAIPADAPVYVYPSAVAALKGSPVLRRAIVIRYAFPESVARHLVRWLIRHDTGDTPWGNWRSAEGISSSMAGGSAT